MTRIILWLAGLAYIINALVMWFAPHFWYESVPGITMMGPFNLHFIRDIGLVYLVGGAGLIYGIRNPGIAVFAAIWPAFHAVYHIFIFFGRGAPIDIISTTNLLLIQIPAWASLWAAWSRRWD